MELTLVPECREPVFAPSRPHNMHISSLVGDYPSLLLQQLQTSGMTDKEKALKKLTWRNLKTLPNWPLWDAAFNKQLDKHAKAGVFGKPILQCDLPPDLHCQVLCLQWTNIVKPCGKQK